MSAPGAEGRSTRDQNLPPFVEGDMLPDIILPNQNANLVQFALHVGDVRAILLLCPDPRAPACRAALKSFARHHAALEPLAKVFAITNTEPEINAAVVGEADLPFWVLSDVERLVAGGMGIAAGPDRGYSAEGAGAGTIVVSDVDWRILKIVPGLDDPDPAGAILEFLQGLPSREARALGHFAPVLYLPKVFEEEFCRTLIQAFERDGGRPSGVYQAQGKLGESKAMINQSKKIRRDFLVRDPVLLAGIERRFGRRVVPAIEKAFTRQVTGVEQFKVVRYDGSDGGFFTAHRDNLSKRQAHRRFAMTLNLNTGEYEGGALRFPEYGPDLYAPDAGDAVVFSCSLLHEATPVTKGHRYVLLTFMYDEESRRFNDRFPR